MRRRLLLKICRLISRRLASHTAPSATTRSTAVQSGTLRHRRAMSNHLIFHLLMLNISRIRPWMLERLFYSNERPVVVRHFELHIVQHFGRTHKLITNWLQLSLVVLEQWPCKTARSRQPKSCKFKSTHTGGDLAKQAA